MNYFSHYLLIPDKQNEYLTLGCILPDFVRDQKIDNSFYLANDFTDNNVHHQAIYNGVLNHIQSDALFHNSSLFKQITKQFAKEIRNSNEISLSKYTYFVAHILLELYIDHILIEKQPDLLNNFYSNIEQASNNILKTYFTKHLPTNDFDLFLLKKDRFVKSRFLFDYHHPKKIGTFLSYVLQKVKIQSLTQKEEKEIINLFEDKFGDELRERLPTLMKMMKQNL